MDKALKQIWFTPEIALDILHSPESITIKGKRPTYEYPFTLYDIYSIIPALNAQEAYQRIAAEYERIDSLMAERLHLRKSNILPPIGSQQEALAAINTLFDPLSYYTAGIWQKLNALDEAQLRLFQLDEVFPFPLKLASRQKLTHTIKWIDTNIKTKVEGIGNRFNLPVHAIRTIVESALKVYCYLIKMQDYQLARSINFNYSMFFQDRILNLFFGDEIYHNVDKKELQGKLANDIALALLKQFETLSYRQLCTFSVFMGVVWTNSDQLQRDFIEKAESALSTVESELNVHERQWCNDEINTFLADIGKDHPCEVVVILDDNGESVFDMALFQSLLKNVELLKVAFIVNRHPVSNNISLGVFKSILNDPYFAYLSQQISQGRASLIVEEQVFRSFEIELLQPMTQRVLNRAEFTYIKGVNFFETFMHTNLTRYHCFVVHGFTSMLLTGCNEGQGVFVKLNPGQAGFIYTSSEKIQTLNQIITK